MKRKNRHQSSNIFIDIILLVHVRPYPMKVLVRIKNASREPTRTVFSFFRLFQSRKSCAMNLVEKKHRFISSSLFLISLLLTKSRENLRAKSYESSKHYNHGIQNELRVSSDIYFDQQFRQRSQMATAFSLRRPKPANGLSFATAFSSLLHHRQSCFY